MKKLRLRKGILRFFLVLFSLLFMFALFNILIWLGDNRDSKKLKDEIINKYGVKVYKEINSDDSYRDKLGALSIDGYCTDILDLEYLAHLLYEFDINCSIDYDNNIFHFNIEHSKENNNQLKK